MGYRYMSRRSEAVKKWKPYRSKFEYDIAQFLKKKRKKFEYETKPIRYTKPATKHSYRPDFILPNGIIIEAKGRFSASDRKKHVLIKQQYPDLDIRFVFQRAANTLTRGANSATYGEWADKNGFLWADEEIPQSWLREKRMA